MQFELLRAEVPLIVPSVALPKYDPARPAAFEQWRQQKALWENTGECPTVTVTDVCTAKCNADFPVRDDVAAAAVNGSGNASASASPSPSVDRVNGTDAAAEQAGGRGQATHVPRSGRIAGAYDG